MIQMQKFANTEKNSERIGQAIFWEEIFCEMDGSPKMDTLDFFGKVWL